MKSAYIIIRSTLRTFWLPVPGLSWTWDGSEAAKVTNRGQRVSPPSWSGSQEEPEIVKVHVPFKRIENESTCGRVTHTFVHLCVKVWV